MTGETDTVDSKTTEANYEKWHESIDKEKLVEAEQTQHGATVAELMGDADGDQ